MMSGKSRAKARRKRERRQPELHSNTNASVPVPEKIGVILRNETTVHAWAGPLPNPESLQHFERTLPGSAERIFQAFERQSAHRESIEARTIASDCRLATAGLIAGAFTDLAALAAAVLIAYTGHPSSAAFIAIAKIAGRAWTYSRSLAERRDSRERQIRQEHQL